MRPPCHACYWFDVDPKNLKQGLCTRYPMERTVIHLGNGRIVESAGVPTVPRDYGCGEHRLKLVDAKMLAG